MSTESTTAAPAVPTELQQNWRFLLGTGIVISLLGVLAFFTPFVTGIAISYLLGGLLIVGGLVHVVNAFTVRGWKGSLWQIILAIVYGLAGISLVVNPLVGLVTLTILVIAYFLVEGIVEIVMAFQMRPEPRWGWVLFSGVVSLVLAALLWVGFPSTAIWAVGLLVGVSLLTTGLSLISVALTGRRAAPKGGEKPETETPSV
ncbi:HdeD family acid-resistance protein [Haloarchaeobius sp. HRN-SO-5]|uniref:HdeD family acid-resistance protein n=1 Tax=Haloarchaeobius sp. HRN-SO-5 TaxID=3446118 RepID=UPI003EBB0899